ncbi:hypothetical protein [Lysinibacillus capsici]|uniref:hypothetical protein n=1 Tax=Lysinibacillus capsici TaxID=2115968 RepID=UPI003081BDE8|nr:hypothetical protein ICJ70_21755 [Lysinibacillus capsici]
MEFVENCSNKFLLIVLLTMGDFMKKGIFEWAIIIWTILLVFLITGWIMIEFYNWKDTIVAAIIAFVGAIIGGSITLIGVNNTIQSNKELALKNSIPKILENIEEFRVQLIGSYNRAFEFSNPREVVKIFESEIVKRGLFKVAANIDKEIYQELDVLIDDFSNCAKEYESFCSSELFINHSKLWEIDPGSAMEDNEYKNEYKRVVDNFGLSAVEVQSKFLERLDIMKNNYLNQL